MYRWESTQFLVLIPISLRSILAKYQTPVVCQAPYSPDMAPCGFLLFPKLKKPLKGKQFQTKGFHKQNKVGHTSYDCVLYTQNGANFQRTFLY